MYAEKAKLHQREKDYKLGNLRTVALDVTDKCNMSCSHCYAETFMRKKPVDLDSLGRAFDELRGMGCYHYVLQGGEPIADPERLEAVVSQIGAEDHYLNLISNGWQMTRETLSWLVGLGIDKVTFSLDSSIEDAHDANRRKGSYARVLNAIDHAREMGLLVGVSTVVARSGVGSPGFVGLLNMARAKQIRLDVQIAMPVGKWDGRMDVLASEADISGLLRLRRESPRLPNGQVLLNRDVYNYGGLDHCPAGSEFMAIAVDGSVLPCNFVQHSLGNVSTGSIRKMRSDLIKQRWFDGTYPVCLAGESEEFISKYIVGNVEKAKPMDAYALYNLDGGNDG